MRVKSYTLSRNLSRELLSGIVVQRISPGVPLIPSIGDGQTTPRGEGLALGSAARELGTRWRMERDLSGVFGGIFFFFFFWEASYDSLPPEAPDFASGSGPAEYCPCWRWWWWCLWTWCWRLAWRAASVATETSA